jgi:hypothetical protein
MASDLSVVEEGVVDDERNVLELSGERGDATYLSRPYYL